MIIVEVIIFVLWDTYGFPLDLTQVMIEEQKLSVDIEGFNVAMNEARKRSRSSQNKQAGGTILLDVNATSELHKRGVVTTYDSFKFTWFQGHESFIKAIYTGNEFVQVAVGYNEVAIFLETTNFYAEQGGQIFDTGSLQGPTGSFEVRNIHSKYWGITSTREGSIVLPEKLRFDFSHGKPVKPEDLRKIESIVNEQIKDDLDVFAKEVTLVDAECINGLRAVFGEVYPDSVRVVSIGQKVENLLSSPDNEEWLSISTELRGWTHITNTREAKAFALLSEEGIAKGIRQSNRAGNK